MIYIPYFQDLGCWQSNANFKQNVALIFFPSTSFLQCEFDFKFVLWLWYLTGRSSFFFPFSFFSFVYSFSSSVEQGQEIWHFLLLTGGRMRELVSYYFTLRLIMYHLRKFKFRRKLSFITCVFSPKKIWELKLKITSG